MDRRRFSIARMMGLILFVAMIFGGLRSGSYDSFILIYSATFLILVYAAIASRYREAFWFGFAVAGWIYFVLGFGQWCNGTLLMEGASVANRNLVSSVVLEIVSSKLAQYDQLPNDTEIVRNNYVREHLTSRTGIAHCALTVLFAFIGGLVSRSMTTRPAERDPT